MHSSTWSEVGVISDHPAEVWKEGKQDHHSIENPKKNVTIIQSTSQVNILGQQ